MDSRIIAATIGFIVGLLVFWLFFKPETQTKVEVIETVRTDTVFVTHIDTIKIFREQIKHTYHRDTILLPDWKPQINAFSAVFPFAYGNAYLSGEVFGEVLKTNLTTNFKLPVVTNTIKRETTRTNTVIQKGLFTGGGMTNQGNFIVGTSYLGNGFIVSLDYSPSFDRTIFVTTKVNLIRSKK